MVVENALKGAVGYRRERNHGAQGVTNDSKALGIDERQVRQVEQAAVRIHSAVNTGRLAVFRAEFFDATWAVAVNDQERVARLAKRAPIASSLCFDPRPRQPCSPTTAGKGRVPAGR